MGWSAWLICGIADCDACFRECNRADGRRAYCWGAEGADWAADAESQAYVIHVVAVAFVVLRDSWYCF